MNKQKTDWVDKFEELLVKCEQMYLNYMYLNYEEYSGAVENLCKSENDIKDFISQLLKTQREEIVSEIEGIVKENRKGTFTDDGGNDCWYIDDLVKELKILENK